MILKTAFQHGIFWVLHVFGAAVWVGIVFRLLDHPENYWGFNILWMQVLFVINILVVLLIKHPQPRLRYALIFNTLSILAIQFLFNFNVLVPYETWLKRDMPARFEFSTNF